MAIEVFINNRNELDTKVTITREGEQVENIRFDNYTVITPSNPTNPNEKPNNNKNPNKPIIIEENIDNKNKEIIIKFELEKSNETPDILDEMYG